MENFEFRSGLHFFEKVFFRKELKAGAAGRAKGSPSDGAETKFPKVQEVECPTYQD